MMKNVNDEHESGTYLIGLTNNWLKDMRKIHRENNEKCELQRRIGDNYVKYNGKCILGVRMGDNYLCILHYFDELCFSIILRYGFKETFSV